jgi:hypothetical protein
MFQHKEVADSLMCISTTMAGARNTSIRTVTHERADGNDRRNNLP